MLTARIAIVGGGLSGLYAAFLLHQRGIEDYVLFDARERLGGRILSASADIPGSSATDVAMARNRVDLGPTWFWPDIQPELDRLICDLNIPRFEQHETGDMLIERESSQPMRMRGFPNAPASMRLAGGMASLTDALAARIDSTRVRIHTAVRGVRHNGADIEVHTEDLAGNSRTTRVEHVLLALPPRLLASTVRFDPTLPESLAREWRNTATWMASHAKYVATYRTPFWREQGLSGDARSMRGPLAEIHDASMDDGAAALFGFFGVPASVRTTVQENVLRALCRAQLVRLFGPDAATPEAEFVKDWSRDPYTSTHEDIQRPAQHLAGAAANDLPDPWRERVTGIASEWSPQFPGYVAGAIESARLGVQRLIAACHRTSG